jgi:hypothetical protein
VLEIPEVSVINERRLAARAQKRKSRFSCSDGGPEGCAGCRRGPASSFGRAASRREVSNSGNERQTGRADSSQERFVLNHTLKDLEAQLNPNRFVRVHRQAIVNVAYIAEIDQWIRRMPLSA